MTDISAGRYVGSHYVCYIGNGGFFNTITLQDISFEDQTVIRRFDLTETVQINYDVRLFNEKIGLVKDASNQQIITTQYDASSNKFSIDSFEISFQEFKQQVTHERVVSVGKLDRSFIDFEIYLNRYFHYADGFNTLLTQESYKDLSNNDFDKHMFVSLLSDTREDTSGNIVPTFQGSIQLKEINNVLQRLTNFDTFNNRKDLSYNQSNGFIEGDLILINPGITFSLQLIIKQESFIPTTQYNGFTLQQTTSAPILLRLQNLS